MAPVPRCHVLEGSPGLRLTLGPRAPVAPPLPGTGAGTEDGDGDDDVALPYSPEIGVGAALGADDFAVSALLPEKGSTSAVVAVLSRALPQGKIIELSKIHGDVSPPRVAASGKNLIVAIPDGAPNGTLVRIARVDDWAGAAHVTWGADVSQGNDESEALALEVGSKTAVVAWDDWNSKDGLEVVKTVTFAPGDVTKLSAPSVLSGPNEDAEGPLLAPRTGGFWAAWMARDARGKHPGAAPAPSSKNEPPQGDTPEAVDTAPRWLMLLPLDEAGKPASAAIRVTPKDAHVQGFDLAPAKDGGALVAFRDDRAIEGTSGGIVRLVVVRADGTVDARTVSDEDVGPAVPSLLVDGASDFALPGWLALTSDSGAARLLALDPQGRGLDVLAVEPSAGTSTLLAVRGKEILATRPRGKGVEAFVLACEKGPPAELENTKPF